VHTPSLYLTLTYDASTTRSKCGCEVFRSDPKGRSVSVRLCSVHAAAPQLLEALELLVRIREDCTEGCNEHTCLYRKAEIAIKAAKETG